MKPALVKKIVGLSLALASCAPLSAKMSSNKKDKPAKICIVRVSEADEKNYGELPWPNSFHANLISKLEASGAQWIAVRHLFERPTNENSDLKLIAACRRFNNVVLAGAYSSLDSSAAFNASELAPFALQDQTKKTLFLSFPNAVLPFRELAEASAGVGILNLKRDGNRFLGYPLVVRVGGQLAPSFALMAALRARGYTRADVQVYDRELRVGYQQMPIAEDGLIPDFKVSAPGSYPTYDYGQIVNGGYRETDVYDAIVLVGYGGKKMDAGLLTESGEKRSALELDADALKKILGDLKEVY